MSPPTLRSKLFDRVTKHPPVRRNTPLGDNEIRILVLLPSSDREAPLQGRYKIQKLTPLGVSLLEDDYESYEAISYTWSAHVYGAFILVDGLEIPIPWNLKLALLRFRDERRARRIWVDSVSINMDDLQERARQILNMRQIFQGASRVLVWLGEEPEDCRGALRFLEKVTQVADVDEVLRGNNSAESWKAVRSVLLQPYFTRAWVVQEIAVARRAIIHLGPESIDWSVFVSAIAVFDKRSLLYPAELLEHDIVKLKGASRFVRIVRKCFRRDEYGNAREPVPSLEQLVFELTGCHASDPRDKIYAFLAIAADIHRDPEQPQITPSYEKSVNEVYMDFYRFCLNSTKTLDVVLRSWSKDQPIPTWLDPASNSELAASLVQSPSEPQAYWTSLLPPNNNLEVSNTGLLKVEGWEFDYIETASLPNDDWDVPVPRSWLKMAAPPLIVPALIQDFGPKYYEGLESTLINCLEQAFQGSSDDEQYLTLISRSTHLTPVLKRIQTLTRGRKLIRSAQRLMIGLAPIGAQEGDRKFAITTYTD